MVIVQFRFRRGAGFHFDRRPSTIVADASLSATFPDAVGSKIIPIPPQCLFTIRLSMWYFIARSRS